jgi:hypothetical protein
MDIRVTTPALSRSWVKLCVGETIFIHRSPWNQINLAADISTNESRSFLCSWVWAILLIGVHQLLSLLCQAWLALLLDKLVIAFAATWCFWSVACLTVLTEFTALKLSGNMNYDFFCFFSKSRMKCAE